MKKNLNISQEELLKLDYKHTHLLKNLQMRMGKLFLKELLTCLDQFIQKSIKQLSKQDFYL